MGHNKGGRKRPLRILGVVAALLLVAVVHDLLPWMQEDSRVVWVCDWHGNGDCGPDAYDVYITVGNLLRWW